MKKALIASCILVSFASLSAIAQNSSLYKENPRPDFAKTPGITEVVSAPQPPKYRYPDNSTKPETELIKKDRVIRGQLKKDLSIKNVRLVKYADLIDEKKQSGDNIVEDMQISPKRQIYVVSIDAQNGIDVPQKGKPNTRFKKANIRMIIDAETGETFGTEITEQNQQKL